MHVHLRHCFLSLFLMIVSNFAYSLENKTFCVWDPVGRNGPVMTFYSDIIPRAQAWGLNLRFVAYTEELQAVEDFKKGKCEAAVLTSILSRQFVKFAGTMDAIGAINSDKALELAIATFARSLAGNLMVDGDYEVFTTFPVGSMYAFVKDRSLNSIDKFKDKTLAIMNHSPQMLKFAELAGAKSVDVTLSNFADKFNKGNLDILLMPALAYNTFELYNGLGDKGGIINYRLYYGMLQTIAKRNEFPEGTGDKMRSYMLNRMTEMNKMVSDAEEEIPQRYWIDVNQYTKDEIDHFSKRVRKELAGEGINSDVALKLFWKIRCRMDASRGECKSDFPEVTPRKQLVKNAPQKPAPVIRQEVQATKTASKTVPKHLEQQKLLESEIAQHKKQVETLAQINAEAQKENERLLQENIEIQALSNQLEHEKQTLNKTLLELEERYKQLEQIVLGEAQNKQSNESLTEENGAPLTVDGSESENDQQQKSKNGGFWHFLFGWMF